MKGVKSYIVRHLEQLAARKLFLCFLNPFKRLKNLPLQAAIRDDGFQ